MNITRYLLKRFSIAAAILLVMSSALFCASRTDDPRTLMLDEHTTEAQWEAWAEEFRLNRPIIVQYALWIPDSMRVDFGNSTERRTSARTIAFEHAGRTLRLLVAGLAFAVLFSAVAILSINYIGDRGLAPEQVGRWARVIVPAIPPFIPAVLFAHIFSFNLLLFPIARDGAWGYVLPYATLGMVIAFIVLRLFFASRKESGNTLNSPRQLTAALGRTTSGSRQLAWRMAANLLRSSRFYLPVLLAAVIFTELIFDMRGMSTFIWGITLFQDFPLASSVLMLLTIAYVAAMFLMDVARYSVDPQVRGGASDASLTDSVVVSSLRPTSPGTWPVFGRRPMVAITTLGLLILLSVCIPIVIPYRGDTVGTDWLYRIFFSSRQALAICAMALIAAAIVGVAAALVANRFGGVIERSLVWLFDLFTSVPILILGIAGYFLWFHVFIYSFLYSYTPVLVQATTYPAFLFAIIISGMFFHQARADTRVSHAEQGPLDRYVVPGVLKVAAISAGPVILLGAIYDAAGGWAAGWGGPIGREQYSLASIWWTLFAALVLILTILSLNFLGQWVKERFDPQPSPTPGQNPQSDVPLPAVNAREHST